MRGDYSRRIIQGASRSAEMASSLSCCTLPESRIWRWVSAVPSRGRRVSVYGFAVALLLTGCEEKNTYVEPPPPQVTVAEPVQQAVTDYLEFTGTTAAVEEVEVRARVPGFLYSMHFQPGTDVVKGALLFVIDPREYEAELQAAEAELEGARAQAERAHIELARAESLYKQQAGSEADVVNWRGERDIAEAAIIRAQAQVERARLNLSYTQVNAPISGRVGRNLVDVGNLVGEGEPTLLTRVTQYNPAYVYFNLNERDLLRAIDIFRQKVQEKGIDPAKDSDREAGVPLELGLANEEGYPHEGVLDFGDSSVDPGTGTLQLRGVFENDEVPPRLLPGLFARVRMPMRKRPDALLVTERAIGGDQSGRFVLVVDGEDTVEKRNIRMGQLVDGLRVIEEGLQPGERVVVNGIQRARPGAKVDPEPIDMASLTNSARAAAAEREEDGGSSSSDSSEAGASTASESSETEEVVATDATTENAESPPTDE